MRQPHDPHPGTDLARSTAAPQTIDALPTPCLLLDRMRLDRNLARMSARMEALGVDLRPHLKTAKSARIAKLATARHSGAITVSTLAEAAYFADHGFDDILYGVAIAPSKLDQVAALRGRGVDLKVVVDSVEGAAAVVAHARRSGAAHRVLVEIDCDGHRSGVEPASDELSAIADVLGPDRLAGVMTHAGESYHCRTIAAIAAMAEVERRAVVDSADRLRAEGHHCPIVSVGSTPTATFAENLHGVTEARPGNYMLKDLFMAGLGVCELDDIAASVLATVIGHNPRRGWVITDAGALALSKDRGTAGQAIDRGYGLVRVPGGPVDETLVVTAVNQEHGLIASTAFDRFPIGSRVEILTNHICMTAAGHAAYHVIEGGFVTEIWERCRGW